MKILYVAPFGLGQKTTVWARILPLAKVIQRANGSAHQVTILIPPWDTPEDAGKCWKDDGVTIENVALTGGLPFIVWRMLRVIAREEPAIIHICKPRAYAGIIQWLLWMISKSGLRRPYPNSGIKPRILLDIDDWEQAWNEMNAHGKLLSRFLTWQEEWGIRHTHGITAASRWLEQRAQEYTAQTPILYLPNGVTQPKAIDYHLDNAAPHKSRQDAASAATFTILYLTRYVEVTPAWLARFWYHTVRRISATRKIRETVHGENPESTSELAIELVIAGGPLQHGRDLAFRQAFEEQLHVLLQQETGENTLANSQAAAADATGSVRLPMERHHWLGLVDRATINQLYATSTCAIFPASPVPLQQAKCSVRLATTLLHGLPTVASAVGQQSEYGGHGAARLVHADAPPEEFGDAVTDLLRDSESREEVSKRARRHLLEAYHWEKLGASLLEFYEECISTENVQAGSPTI